MNGSVPKYAFSFTIFSNTRYSEELQKIFFQKQEDVFRANNAVNTPKKG
jgi:hypothetical protein